MTEVAQYATGIGFADTNLWDYKTNQPSATFYQAKDLGLIVHLWTFKDDVLFFNAKTNLEMYHIGHQTFKLDGVITEFADIYAPLAQIWKRANLEKELSNQKKCKHGDKSNLQAEEN